jgi:TonB family protein
MIHDRFYSQWDQPTSIYENKHQFVTTVKIRIQSDGTVSSVSLARPSGNTVMDESVMAAARRVKQIDPLPKGLGTGGSFEIQINFQLE